MTNNYYICLIEPKAQNMDATSLKKIVTSATDKMQDDNNQIKIVTDFHIAVDNSNGNVTISDDDGNALATGAISELISASEQDTANYLKEALAQIDKQGTFDSTNIYKPFSFLMEDSEEETTSELLIVDDENIYVSDELLKGLEQELDEFFANLMKED